MRRCRLRRVRRIREAEISPVVRGRAYQAARGLNRAAAADLVDAANRIAAAQAGMALARTVREAANAGAAVRSCAVIVGAAAREPRLEWEALRKWITGLR